MALVWIWLTSQTIHETKQKHTKKKTIEDKTRQRQKQELFILVQQE